jgi:DnaJ-class molecular chaperone
MYVILDVEIPKKLSRDQKRLFEELSKTNLKDAASFDKIKKHL